MDFEAGAASETKPSFIAFATPLGALRLARASVAGMLLTFALLAAIWVGYIRYASAALHYPYGLDYSEGLIWQQVQWLFGPHMYGDISHYPFVVFEYPPLYLLAVKAVHAAGVGMLPAGRAISMTGMLSLCALVGLVTWQASDRGRLRTPKAWIGGLLAALLPAALLPFISWSVLMRVDMLALALTYAGIALATWSLRRPGVLYAAVLVFVAASFTKQIYLAAPISMAAVMLIRSPLVAVRAYTLGAALGVGLLATLTALTDGGFFRHVVTYNVDSVNLAAAAQHVGEWLRAYPILAGLVPISMYAAWRHALVRDRARTPGDLLHQIRHDSRFAFLAFLTIYTALTTAMLISAGKTGSSRNYFLEWMAIWCVWIGLFAAQIVSRVGQQSCGRARRNWELAGLSLSIALPLQISPIPFALDALRTEQFSPAHRDQASALLTRLRQLPGLVLSDDMVALMQSGHEVGLEPGILLELAGTGLWREQTLIDMLQDRQFSALVTAYDPGDPTFNSRYLPATQAAMLRAYPRVELFGDYRLRLP